MKSIHLTLLCVGFCYLTTSLQAQVPLPYYSGFDNAAERAGWTIYRLGESAINSWSIASVGGFSPSSSISHDYSPSSGVNLVDDWYVSPGFLVPGGGTLDSVRYAFSGFSVPAEGDTIGVYLLLGNQHPGFATEIIELKEFRDTDYQPDNMYRLLSGIPLPATNKMAFIGLRYRNAQASSRWIHVRFDNIAVSESTTSIEPPETSGSLTVYPNPTLDQVTITHNETGGIVYMYDQQGVLLRQLTLQNDQMLTTLSIEEMPTGVYRFAIQQKDRLETVSILKM